MEICELNKFIQKAELSKIYMDCYNFNPVTEKATISKGSQSVVIDLTKSVEVQEEEFQIFMNGLGV